MEDAGELGTEEGDERRDTGEEHARAGVEVDESVKIQQKRFEIIKPFSVFLHTLSRTAMYDQKLLHQL